MRDHGANNFVLGESNRPIGGTLDFSGCGFISSFENFAPPLQKSRKCFTDGNSDGFRGQSEDKEVAILINYRSIVRRNAEQVRSV